MHIGHEEGSRGQEGAAQASSAWACSGAHRGAACSSAAEVVLDTSFQVEVINDAQRSIKDIEDAITQACCDNCSSHMSGDKGLCESQVEGCQTRLVHMRYARPALQRANCSQVCIGSIIGPVHCQRCMEVRRSESL